MKEFLKDWRVLLPVSIVILICIESSTVVYRVYCAEKSETVNTLKPATPSVFQKNENTSTTNQENSIRETQINIDKSISILNIVATLMGVLVGLLTAILVIGGIAGFFEYKRWKSIIKEGEENLKVIKGIRKKAEEEMEKSRKETQVPALSEIPSEELKKRLEEFSHRLETLEMLGVSLKPEDYSKRGYNLYHKGKYELALKSFEKVIELDPDNAQTWFNKGVTLGELGRHDDAFKAYEKAIKLNPDNAWAWFNRACAYSLKGDKRNALQNLSKAIELDAKCKETAKKDEDFKNLWDDEDFKRIAK